MNDYIERERALAILHKGEFGTPDERWHPESEIAEVILRLPAADVAPVKHGRWELTTQDDGYGEYQVYRCDKCGAFTARQRNYCHTCGAKMDGGGDDDK